MQKKTLLRIEATIYTITLIIMSITWYNGLISIGSDPNKTISLLLFFLIILVLSNFIWFDQPEKESDYEQEERHNMQLFTRMLIVGLFLLTFANKLGELIEYLSNLII